MGYLVADRAALRRRFFVMVGSSSTDESLIEQDQETLEQANYYLMHGIWRAQAYMIGQGYSGWRATQVYGTGGTAWSGSDAVDGGRYAALPAAFIKLNGDQFRSALRVVSSPHERWGTLIPDDDLLPDAYGPHYAIRGTGSHDGQIWLARAASPPEALVMDYFAKHAVLTADTGDGSAVDLPDECAPLAVAYAADLASGDSWLPGGPEMVERIALRLQKAEDDANRWISSLSRAPKVLEAKPAHFGTWMG